MSRRDKVDIFNEQCAVVGGGWTAMRYHDDGGVSVSEMLSFNSVFEVNPFGGLDPGWRENPCARRARSALERVSRWLDAHPKAASVCVAHSMSHVPQGFDREILLPPANEAAYSPTEQEERKNR